MNRPASEWTEPFWASVCDCTGRVLLIVSMIVMVFGVNDLSLRTMIAGDCIAVAALFLSIAGYIPTWLHKGKRPCDH